MKKVLLTAVTVTALIGAGISLERYILQSPTQDHSDHSTSKEQSPLYWVAPMDPNYRRDRPGKSPMGMDLVPVYAESDSATDQPGTVAISSQVENNLGVRTEAAIIERLTPSIDTVGSIGFDEDSLYQINSRAEGWIENLQIASPGDYVEKGTLLFELYSPSLVNAQEEYLAALKSGNRALISAARDRLRALAIPEETITRLDRQRKIMRTLPFQAPRSGYISKLGVRPGSYITPATTILELASLDSVWVVAEVFERQSQQVKSGQNATMTVDYLPGQKWHGKVDYVYPSLNSQTRSLRVRLRFANPDGTLKPNMYSRIKIDTAPLQTLSIPRSALIMTGTQSRVVKALGEGKFRSIRVLPGREVGDRIEILKGLKPGERVVTSAQFLLDSESSINADLSRYEDNNSRQVWLSGVILARHGETLQVSHDPVPEWDQPAMVMELELAPGIASHSLTPGEHLQFQLDTNPQGQFQISALRLTPAKPGPKPAPKTDHSGHTMHQPDNAATHKAHRGSTGQIEHKEHKEHKEHQHD